MERKIVVYTPEMLAESVADADGDADLVVTSGFKVEGFDPADGWDPTVELRQSGLICIEFPDGPPDNVRKQDGGDGFTDAISRAVGVSAHREDREAWQIEKPEEDTFDRLKEFFLNY